MGGRGSVNVDVAVIVTKLEEFVKEQVELTCFFYCSRLLALVIRRNEKSPNFKSPKQ